MSKRVLVACEESGVVRDAFRAAGHVAWSNDLSPSDDSQFHLQMDCMKAITECGPWDIIIMHPPCDYLALSGNRWYGVGTEGHQKRVEAIEWTLALWRTACDNAPYVAMENPTSVIFKHISAPVQYIQPWQFGHKEQKKTGFALWNLPRLYPTEVLEVPDKNSREYIEWQKVWRMAPSADRKRLRSRTYEGVAQAMAEQCGRL